MKKVTICITETLQRLVVIEVSNNDTDVEELVHQQYQDGEHVLDADDLISTEFEVLEY